MDIFNTTARVLTNISQNDSNPCAAFPAPKELVNLEMNYQGVHGYIAIIICLFGIPMNILNIIVLTRPGMITATNIILSAIALADMTLMAFYFCFALQNYIIFGVDDSREKNTYASAVFLYVYSIFSIISHGISVWLTVVLGIFRFVYIRFPSKGVTLCNLYRTKLAIFLTSLGVIVAAIPNIVYLKIVQDQLGQSHLMPIYLIDNTNIFQKYMYKINNWDQALIFKILPCCILTVMVVLLVREMKLAVTKRKRLLTSKNRSNHRDRTTNRTTRMLLAVVVMFVVIEFPQGILFAMSIFSVSFYCRIYQKLADFMDFLVLINSTVNFILYCVMSQQFRDTFSLILFQPILKKFNKYKNIGKNNNDSLRIERTEMASMMGTGTNV